MARVKIEIKNILRKHVKKCGVCRGKKFQFTYDPYIEDLIWMKCRYCRRVLYLGTGEDLGWTPEIMQIKEEMMWNEALPKINI